MADPSHTVLVFGDSLTWGWTPTSPTRPTVRHPRANRWTSVMAAALGPSIEVIVEGLSGRTTNVEDPNDPRLNGARVLPALLASHEPLDLVIIMLGTNDTKIFLDRTPLEIGFGAGALVAMARRSPLWQATRYGAPEVLLVSPPPLGPVIAADTAESFNDESREKGRALAEVYRSVAAAAGAHAFDAGSVIETDGVDGIHLTAAANRTLGAAVAQDVKRILGK